MPTTHICQVCDAKFQGEEQGLPNTLYEGWTLYNSTMCPLHYHLKDEARDKLRVQLSRAKKVGAPATLTFKQWLLILDYWKWSCAYCEGSYDTMDHVIPLSQGGGTTADNCLPCCVSCNPRKNGRPLEAMGLPQAVLNRVQTWLAFQKRAWRA